VILNISQPYRPPRLDTGTACCLLSICYLSSEFWLERHQRCSLHLIAHEAKLHCIALCETTSTARTRGGPGQLRSRRQSPVQLPRKLGECVDGSCGNKLHLHCPHPPELLYCLTNFVVVEPDGSVPWVPVPAIGHDNEPAISTDFCSQYISHVSQMSAVGLPSDRGREDRVPLSAACALHSILLACCVGVAVALHCVAR
jgi:hypothetical protein